MNGREHVLAAIKRAVLPVSAFIVVMELHFGFQVLNYKLNPTAACPPEATADGSCCRSPDETSAFRVYLQGQGYWLGISYALPLAFAVTAFRRYREQRSAFNRKLAIGGLTLYGVLAAAGCFLTGCCGSPMLAVYASFLGATYLPFAKPLLAGFSAFTVVIAWWWMNRSNVTAACNCSDAVCCSGDPPITRPKQTI